MTRRLPRSRNATESRRDQDKSMLPSVAAAADLCSQVRSEGMSGSARPRRYGISGWRKLQPISCLT